MLIRDYKLPSDVFFHPLNGTLDFIKARSHGTICKNDLQELPVVTILFLRLKLVRVLRSHNAAHLYATSYLYAKSCYYKLHRVNGPLESVHKIQFASSYSLV